MGQEFFKLFKGKHIGQRIHANAVRDLFKAVGGFAADAVGRGRGVVQLRVFLLDVHQLIEKPVVLVVGYFRCILHVIFFGVVVQLLAEFVNPRAQLPVFRSAHGKPPSGVVLLVYPYYTRPERKSQGGFSR